jgi:hypothetical protein
MDENDKKNNFINFCLSKLKYYNDLLNNTIQSCNYFKSKNIFTTNDFNNCIFKLENLYKQLEEAHKTLNSIINNDNNESKPKPK